jgi:two-component system sensor histidine kinase/response regulator
MNPMAVDGGEAALRALEEAEHAGKAFPLVLLDSRMPEMDGFTLAGQIKQKPGLAGAMLVMLTSAGVSLDAALCRELGIVGYLVKPFRQLELLKAIRTVLGREVTQQARTPQITKKSVLRGPRSLRILLAEDNPVNQVLAVRLLEREGHQVTVTNNGVEAIAAFENKAFDLVVMDVEMPEMNGLQATASIREQERLRGGHVPIIAMTANAMAGDKARFLAAGMDAYVSKPIDVAHLFESIELLLHNQPKTAQQF